MRTSINQTDVEKLRKLYQQLPTLTFDARVAIRGNGYGNMEGEDLDRYRQAASKLADAFRQIAEITVR